MRTTTSNTKNHDIDCFLCGLSRPSLPFGAEDGSARVVEESCQSKYCCQARRHYLSEDNRAKRSSKLRANKRKGLGLSQQK
eukprot:209131-Amphidinium_carterae.1